MSCRHVDPMSDLSLRDLWFPQRAEHYIGVFHLFGVRPLALQPAHGIFCGHTVSFCYPQHRLKERRGFKERQVDKVIKDFLATITNWCYSNFVPSQMYYLLLWDNGDPDFVDHVCPAGLQENCCIHHTHLFTWKRAKVHMNTGEITNIKWGCSSFIICVFVKMSLNKVKGIVKEKTKRSGHVYQHTALQY